MSDNGTPALTDEELRFLEGVLDLAREGRTEQLIDMITAGVPVNLTNARGDTALILAAYHQHPDAVTALIEAGADTGRVNDMGQTALAAAVFRNSEPSVRALLDAGADPAVGAHTAMQIAQQFDLVDMQRLLAEYAR